MRSKPPMKMSLLMLGAATIAVLAACGAANEKTESTSTLNARLAECVVHPESKDYTDTRFHVREVREGIPAACKAAKETCSARYHEYCWALHAKTL